MADKLIVGKNCSTGKVINSFFKQTAQPVDDDNWRLLAQRLGVSDGLSHEWVMTETTPKQFVAKIIQKWVEKKKDKATLKELIHVVDFMFWEAVRDQLKRDFGLMEEEEERDEASNKEYPQAQESGLTMQEEMEAANKMVGGGLPNMGMGQLF